MRSVAPEQPRLPGLEDVESPLASDSSPSLGGALSDEQRPAVERRAEPLLLSAAAGSGKTSVLVERFVRAVREDGIAPGRILAITFTDRAAGELRTRIRAGLLALDQRQAAQDAESAYLTTFHGFCARLLRAHPLACGLDPDFEVLDEGLAARLRERAFAAALRAMLGQSPPAVDLAAAYGVDRLRRMVEQAFLELRSRGQRRPRLPSAGAADAAALSARDLLDELLGRFADVYEQLKDARNSLDFDDLELRAAELLHGHEGVRRSYAERFELTMVDEFQDTNARQLRILEALDRGSLFTVGDELQSIYGFRHADVRLFRARRAALEQHGRSLALTRNFRSRPRVLEVVNAAFAARFEDFAPLRAGREELASEPTVELLLTATAGWDGDAALARRIAAGLPDGQLWRQAEARLLAQRVAELVGQGRARAGEVVVLLRSTPDLEIYERALQLCGLETLATVGTFWGQQQIGDVLSYLRALANPLDEEALFGALASPLGGLSRDGLALLAAARRARGEGLWQTVLAVAEVDLGPRDRAALERFRELLAGERAIAASHSIGDLIERALLFTGYEEHVLGLDWGERRLANLDKLLREARRFERREGRDLRAFLDHVRHLERMALLEPQAPLDGVEHDAVQLMSVHAAKGLEFEVVCVADLGRRPRLTQPDLLVDGERLGLRLATLDGAEPRAAFEHAELARERAEREAEEEDRVLYVAMTRARERLLLSGAIDFARAAGERSSPTSPPITWLLPALAPELPERLAAGEDVDSIPLAGGELRVRVNAPWTGERLLLPSGGEAQMAVPRAPARERARRVPAETEAQGEGVPTLSYTSLAELERCGYRFYLERVLGLPEDRAAARGDGGLKARERGTLVHALMERLDLRRLEAPAADAVLALAATLGIVLSRDDAAAASALAASTFETELMARVRALREVRREHPFAFSVAPEDPLVVGFIDLLGEQADGSPLLLDYKTDHLAAQADPGEAVAREYAAQRLVYALAVLRAGAARVEVVHWFLERPHEPVAALYEAAQLPALEAELAAAMRRPYTVSPVPHRALCLTCPGRRGLCSWGEEQTLRESAEEAGRPENGGDLAA
jgi:ATP-dependent helicase/nuclease subunit A